MVDNASKHAGHNDNRSPKRTPRHFKKPLHLRHDPSSGPSATHGVRPWHLALSIIVAVALVVASLHTDAIADVLGLSATTEPVEVTEVAPADGTAAGEAAATDGSTGGGGDELASAEREAEETGRAAAEEIERETDEAAAKEAEATASDKDSETAVEKGAEPKSEDSTAKQQEAAPALSAQGDVDLSVSSNAGDAVFALLDYPTSSNHLWNPNNEFTSGETRSLGYHYMAANVTCWLDGSGAGVKKITPPTTIGYDFLGYWTKSGDNFVTKCIDSDGTILLALMQTPATGTMWIPGRGKNEQGVKLYPRWERSYFSLTYDLDGGVATGDMPSEAQTIGWFGVQPPTRAGYTFKGWQITGMDTGHGPHYVAPTAGSSGALSTTSSSVDTSTLSGYSPTWYGFANLRYTAGTVNMKALWTANAVYMQFSNNWPGDVSDFIVREGPWQLGYYVDTPTYWVNGTGASATNLGTLPAYTGYVFDGYWTKGESGNYGEQVIPASGALGADVCKIPTQITIYAKWVPKEYSISYNLDGGTQSGQAPAKARVDSWFGVDAPTRRGYDFAGWSASGMSSGASQTHGFAQNADGTGGSTSTTSTSYTVSDAAWKGFKNLRYDTGTTTLKANWNARPYVLTLDKASPDASQGTAAVHYTFDTSRYYTDAAHATEISKITIPVREGYTFDGYYSEPGGAGTKYVAGDGSFVNDPYKAIAEDTTLYANWTRNTFAVADVLDQTYDQGRDITPALSVTGSPSGQTLVEGRDYALQWSSNYNVGIATVVVSGINDFKDADPVTKTFSIQKATGLQLRRTEVDKVYDNAAAEASVAVETTRASEAHEGAGTAEPAEIYYSLESVADAQAKAAARDAGARVAPSFTAAGDSTVYYYVAPSNYVAVSGSLSAHIAKRPVTVEGLVPELDRTYNGSTAIALDNSASRLAAVSGNPDSGPVAGDAVSLDASGARASVQSADVGSGKAVSVVGFSLSGASAASYELVQPTVGAATINKAPLAVTWPAASEFNYDSTAKSYTATGVSGVQNGEVIYVTGYANEGAVTTAATSRGSYVARVTGLSFEGGAKESNYQVDNSTFDHAWEIRAAVGQFTYAVQGVDAIYDGQAHAATLVGTGACATEPCEVYWSESPLDASNYTTGSKGSSSPAETNACEKSLYYYVVPANYEPASGGPVSLKVTPKALSVSGVVATDRPYDGTRDVEISTGSLVGAVAGDDVALVAPTSGVAVQADAGDAIEVVPSSGYSLSGSGAGNYRLASQPNHPVVNISPREVSALWPSANSMPFNGAEQAYLVQGFNGLVAGEQIGVAYDSVGHAERATDVGTYVAKVASLVDGTTGRAANYAIDPTSAERTWSITKAQLVIRPRDNSATYGSAPAHDDSVTYTYLDKVDQPSAPADAHLTGTLSIERLGYTAATSDAGAYALRASGVDSSNYEVVFRDGTLTVQAKELSLAWPASAELAYNGQLQSYNAELVGVINDDDVRIGSYVDNAATDVGAHTARATLLAGAKAGNYSLPADSTHAWSIVRADNPATVTLPDWTYGHPVAPSVSTRWWSSAPAGTPVTFSYFIDEACTRPVPASNLRDGQPKNVGAYWVLATIDEPDTANWKDSSAKAQFSITPASIEVTADDKSSKYQEETVPLTWTVTGDFHQGDELSVSISTTATSTSGYGAYPISVTAGPSGNPNYSIAFSEGTYSIAKSSVRISASGFTTVYDAANHGITVTASSPTSQSVSDGVIIYYSASSLQPVIDQYLQSHGKSYADLDEADVQAISSTLSTTPGVTSAASGQESPLKYRDVEGSSHAIHFAVLSRNYEPDVIAGSKAVTITRLPITARVVDLSATYGESADAIASRCSVSYDGSGFVGGDTSSVVTGTPVFSLGSYAAGAQSGGVGTYPVTVSGLSASNYDVVFEPGALTVGPLPVSLTWASTSLTYNGQPQGPSAAVANALSGDDVFASALEGNVQTSAGAYSGTSAARVTALGGAQAANYTLQGATGISSDWQIAVAPNEVHFEATDADAYSWTYGDVEKSPSATASFAAAGEPTLTYYAASGSVTEGPQAFEPAVGEALPSRPTDAGDYYVKAAVAGTSDYEGATAWWGFKVHKRDVAVRADDKSSAYGSPIKELTWTLSSGSLVTGDSLNVMLSGRPDEGAAKGTYPITVSEAAPGNPNYNVTYQGGTYTVTAAAMRVTATGWSGTYDGAEHAPSVITQPVGDAVVYYSTTAQLTPDNYESGSRTVPTFTGAGEYTVYYYVHSTNYTAENQEGLAYGSVTIRVDKKDATVWAGDASLTYGGAALHGTPSVTGLVPGDSAAVSADGSSVSGVISGSFEYAYTYDVANPAARGVGAYQISVASSSLASDNYQVSFEPGTLTVRPLVAQFSWSDTALTYTGLSQSPKATVSNTCFDDDVTVAALSGAPMTDVGAYTASPSSLGGAQAANYAVSAAEGTTSRSWSITKADNSWVDGGAPAISGWTYGTAAVAPTSEATFGPSTVAYTYQRTAKFNPDGTTSAVDEPATSAVPTQAGTYRLVATVPGTSNYHELSGETSFTIARAAITVTAEDHSTEYLADLQAFTYQVSGAYVAGDALGVAYDCVATPTSNVGTYPITPSVTNPQALSNYDVTCVAGTYRVTRPVVDVLASGWSGAYDAAPHGATVALSRAVSGTTIYLSETPLHEGNYNEDGQQASPTRTDAGVTRVYYYVHSDNYEPTPKSGYVDVEISRTPLTVSARDNQITYGDAPAASGVTYAGFVGSDDEGVLEGTLAYDFTYAQFGNVGTYERGITPKGLSAQNYDISYVPATLTVVPLPVRFDWQGDVFTYNGNAQGPTAHVANVQNNDDVAPSGYASEGPIQASAVHRGDYTAQVLGLTGSRAANYLFESSADDASHAWSIAQAPNSVTNAQIDGWTYDGRSNASAHATASFGQETMRFEYSDRADFQQVLDAAPVNAGDYFMRAVVDEPATGDWAAASSAVVPFSVAKAPVTITAKDAMRPYEPNLSHDGLFDEAGLGEKSAYVVGGNVAQGDDLGIQLDVAYPGGGHYVAGEYAITVSWNGNPNYDATLRNGVYLITEGTLGVTASGFSGFYDGVAHGILVTPADPTVTVYYAKIPLNSTNYLVSGVTNPNAPGVTCTDVDDSCNIYYYIPAGNYQEVAGSKPVSITKAPLSVIARPHEVTYGDGPANSGVSYVGLVNGETEAVLGGTLDFDYTYARGDDAGGYAITPKGLTSSNYAISFQSAQLIVNRKPTTFSWYGSTFAYDGTEHAVSASVDAFEADDVRPSGIADAAKVDAGSYVAVVAGIEGAKAHNYAFDPNAPSVRHAWRIDKAQNAATVSVAGWTYGKRDAAANAPAVTSTWGSSTAQVTYWRDAACTASQVTGDDLLDGAPRHAGTYYARCEVPEAANWEGCVAVSEAFQVSPANITISASDAAIKYRDGLVAADLRQAADMGAEGQPAGPRSYTVTGDYVAGDDLGVRLTLEPSGDSTYHAGAYAIGVEWNSNPDYSVSRSSEGDSLVGATYYVTKADVRVTSSDWAGTYDGQRHGITVTADAQGNDVGAVVYFTKLPIVVDPAATNNYFDGSSIHIAKSTVDTINGSDVEASNAAAASVKALLGGLSGVVTSSTANAATFVNVADTPAPVRFIVFSRDGNPDIMIGERTVAITKRPLTVTAVDQAITYGEAPHAHAAQGAAGVSLNLPAGMVSDLVYPAQASDQFAYDYAQGQSVGQGTFRITPRGITSSNYELAFAPGTLSVSRKPVVLTWGATQGSFSGDSSFTYDSTPKAVGATITDDNKYGSDDVRVSGYSGEGATSAGDYLARAMGLAGSQAANYVVDASTQTTFDWQITQAANQWSNAPHVDGWTYGQAAKTPSSQARFGSPSVSYFYKKVKDGAGADIPGAADADWVPWGVGPSGAGTYLLRSVIPGTNDYQGIDTASDASEFVVAQAQVTVTADDKASGYGSDAQALTYRISATGSSTGSYMPGDSLGTAQDGSDWRGILLKTYRYTDATRTTTEPEPTEIGPDTPVGVFQVRASVQGEHNLDYNVTLVNGTYTLSRANVNINARGYAAAYDGQRHGVDIEVGPMREGNTATVWYSTVPMMDEAAWAAVPKREDAAPGEAYRTSDPLDESVSQVTVGERDVYYFVECQNYDAVPISGKLTVEVQKAPLTVTANDASATFGDAPADAGVTYQGFVEGEGTASGPEPGVLEGELLLTHEYVRYGDVGAYAITPSGLSGANYEVTFVPGTLTVAPREIDDAWLTLDPAQLEHTGAKLKPGVSVTMPADAGAGGEGARDWPLVEGRDFELSGDSASSEFGTHEFALTGTGNFSGTLTRSWRVTGERTEVGRAAIGDGEGILETDVLVDGITIEVDGLTVELLRSLMTPEELAEVEAGATGILYLQVQRVDKLAAEDEDPTVAKLSELGAEPGLRLDVTLWKQIGSHAASRITDTGGPEVTITFDVPGEIATGPAGFERSFWGVRSHEGTATVLCGPSTDVTIVMGSRLFSGFTVGYRDEELPSGQGDGVLPTGEAVSGEAPRIAPTGDATPTVAVLAVALAGAGALAYGRRRRRRDR